MVTSFSRVFGLLRFKNNNNKFKEIQPKMVGGKGKNVAKNFQELLHDTDPEFLKFLDKADNGKSIDVLVPAEREQFWVLFLKVLTECLSNENVENNTTVSDLLKLFLYILSNTSANLGEESKVVEILTFINSIEFSVKEDSTKNNISLINEFWMTKKNEYVIPGMEYFTTKYLLEQCLVEKPLVTCMNRLNSIRKFITATPFEIAVPSLRPFLVKLVQSQTVMNSEHIRRFLAHALLLSQRVMLVIHKEVMLELHSCNKKKAACYAKIYLAAWQNTEGEMRTAIEKKCFQHLMELFLREERKSLELTKLGHNLLAVLNVWHSERTKKSAEYTNMITDCYQPIIWKYLESSFNVHRCNAVDLLFKAFPLQRPSDNVLDAERLFNQQFAAMASALKDKCHIVRIIAVREVCNILAHYWNSFTPIQIQKLLTIITKENAHDSSTADVRRMVYVGLQSFLDKPLPCQYLKQILPTMSDNIHDINQKVRIAFVQLLIAIKEKKDPNLKCSDLIPAFSLYYRLAEDNIKVGQLIVQLLINSYFREDMTAVEWLKKFVFLIKTYPKSYRNFFLYSENALSFSNAFMIMCEIILRIGSHVKSKTSEEDADYKNDEMSKAPKRPNKRSKNKKALGCNNEDRSEEEINKEKGNAAKVSVFDDPLVVEGLFDVVTILWVLHDNKLTKPENQEKLIKLYETYLAYAQPFINYYKETALFRSVVCLSGNIPSSLLRSNNITLPGYCIKILKSQCRDPCNGENMLTVLAALIKWGKGADVLEQVALWLDAAFETQDLNATILPRKKVKIKETIQPNSVVAVRILDTLMKIEYVKMSVLKKNYAQLFELWKFMSRIKKIIETRVEQNEPFEDDLVSDEFIKICFKRYVKFIPFLKDNKEGESEDEKNYFVNYQQEMEDLMRWAQDVMYPLLRDGQNNKAEDIDLIVSIYKDILFMADNLIILNMATRQFYSKIGHLIINLLKTRYELYFVKSATRIAAAINYSGKILFDVNDDLNIFSKIVPCIVSHILYSLTSKKLSNEQIEIIEPDLAEVKKNLGKILDTYHDNFRLKTNSRETVKQLQALVRLFLNALLTSISNDITEANRLITYKIVKDVPVTVSLLLSFFYNKKFWGPIFVHVWKGSLSAEGNDVKSLLAGVIILHFFSEKDEKVKKGELKKILSSLANTLKSEMDKRNRRKDISARAIPEKFSEDKSLESDDVPESVIQDGLNTLCAIQENLCRRTIEEDE